MRSVYKVAVTFLICITLTHYQNNAEMKVGKIGRDVETSHWASLIATVIFPAVLTTLDKLAPVFVLPTSLY